MEEGRYQGRSLLIKREPLPFQKLAVVVSGIHVTLHVLITSTADILDASNSHSKLDSNNYAVRLAAYGILQDIKQIPLQPIPDRI